MVYMPTDRQLLSGIKAEAARVELRQLQLRYARDGLRKTIREAHKAGVAVTAIAEASGYSRVTVHKLVGGSDEG